jgi:peptidoglycan/LPS O-acetylase OafA/YrhL
MTSPPARIEALDALRGIAATGVASVHAAYMFPLGPGIPDFIGNLVLGVPLFFILSAFSMSVAYSGGLSTKASLANYGMRRLFRIAPLFYLLLALWIAYFRYLGSPAKAPEEIYLNLLFVFSLFPAYQSSIVPAGWSIGVEMVFYAVFPLLILSRGVFSALVFLCASLLVAWHFNSTAIAPTPDFYHWTHPLTNAPYFCFGMLMWRVMNRLKDWNRSVVATCLLGLSAILVAFMGIHEPSITGEQVQRLPVSITTLCGWGLAFSLLVLSQALKPMYLFVNPLTGFLGKISYSLYLSHPLLIYSTGIPLWAARWAPYPDLVAPMAILSVLVVAVPVAWLLYTFVEAPFMALGRRLTTQNTLLAQPAEVAVARENR